MDIIEGTLRENQNDCIQPFTRDRFFPETNDNIIVTEWPTTSYGSNHIGIFDLWKPLSKM